MIGALKRAYGNFRGFDLSRSAVPPMEGPLKPNTELDAAPKVLTLPQVDNLAVADGTLYCTSGAELFTLESRPQADTAVPGLAVAGNRTFPAPISCLTAEGDTLAVGLDGRGITILGGRHDGHTVEDVGGSKLTCPTAAAFIDADTLVVANGSTKNPASEWKRDLMTRGATGSVWAIDLRTTGKAERIAADLAWPSGVAAGTGGTVFVSEAWRHRVLAFDRNTGSRTVALDDLPAYPGRIAGAADGGFWLALFAPRNAMVEFVLLEDEYRERMIRGIDPDYWIAPSLLSGQSFLEPIQGGARKKLNMLKPWSPSWSYGLVSRCDAGMRPSASYHSRADGSVHGVTALAERGGYLYAAARGSGVVVAIETQDSAGGRP